MRSSFKAIMVILVLIILGGAGFGVYAGYDYFKKKNIIPVIPIDTTADGTGLATTSWHFVPSLRNTSAWKQYANDELGFQVSYPPDMIAQANGTVLTLTFPTDIYFHWPLQDEARITVTATSTCPALDMAMMASTTTFTLDAYAFTYAEGTDVGAGNRYREMAYDTEGNGGCYQILFYDHGTNGAGFYVDDQDLIKRYDSQHDADMAVVLDVLNAVTGTFRVRSTPPGTLER